MDARLRAAHAHYRHCMLCERRCGSDRLGGERGFCKAGTTIRLVRHRIEYSEESDLIPSHLFYLSGCDLRCAFCIAGINAFDPSRGQELTPTLFNAAVEWGRRQGARNIQWVGGEPTIHLPAILDVMASCPDLPPVVWKSDFHGTPEVFDLLDGLVDVYVADFKFGNDQCAARLSRCDDYLRIITRNLKIASQRSRLIVRHLVLPGHTDCCLRPICQWMREHLPDVEFSLRDGYLPSWRSNSFPELCRPLDRQQRRQAMDIALSAGLRVIQ